MRRNYLFVTFTALSSLGVFFMSSPLICQETHWQVRDHDTRSMVILGSADEVIQKLGIMEKEAQTAAGLVMEVQTSEILDRPMSQTPTAENRTFDRAGHPAPEGLGPGKQTAKGLEPNEWISLPATDPGVPINSSGGLPPWLDPRTGPLVREVEAFNNRQPLNVEQFPLLPRSEGKPLPILLVLYVHNRPAFLRATVRALAQVEGINETTLIVSHDGYFPEVHDIVQGIRFCRVKQIYTPFSPHLHPGRFPGVSPNDCNKTGGSKPCLGDPDPWGHYRQHNIVSLKHHWWWLMNTVWGGRIAETRDHMGYIAFFEEDHYLHPNAYRTLQALVQARPRLCPQCQAVQLGPFKYDSRDDGYAGVKGPIIEHTGNLCYAFNSSTWAEILSKRDAFCAFDDYNWDISLRVTVFSKMKGGMCLALRSPWRSVTHFGTCGLHSGKKEFDNGSCAKKSLNDVAVPKMREVDTRVNLLESENVTQGYAKLLQSANYGGWSDRRDQELCRHLAFIGMMEK